MKRIISITGLGLVIALAAGVFLAFAPDDDPSTGSNLDLASYRDHNELLMDVGRKAPEFGGMYLSPDNDILYVYLTDADNNAIHDVKEAIDDVFRSDLTQREVRVIDAQYSIAELYTWYSRVVEAVFQIPAVGMTDLDEGHNRIHVGVDTLLAEEEVREALRKLNVPVAAVTIAVQQRPRFIHTLRDREPSGDSEGGYQISRYSGGYVYRCTLGFNTVRSDVEGFVTAGHCTEANWDGLVDSPAPSFYQEDNTPTSNLIGTETVDPGLSASVTGCPSGKICRRSDSAFVTLESGVTQNLGRIAKTTGLGSNTVSHVSHFRITEESNSTPSTGQLIYFVGKSSGWESGNVSSTCGNYAIATDHVLVCQVAVDGDATNGDSGAPAFRITNDPNTNDVKLMGVVWGTTAAAGGDPARFYYSSLAEVYSELGASETWDSCDSSQNC